MRRLLLSLSFLCLAMAPMNAAQAQSAPVISPEAFQQLYLERVKSTHPQLTVVSATVDEIVFKTADGGDFIVYLGNGYRRHQEGQSAAEVVDVLIALVDRKYDPITADTAYALIRPVDFLSIYAGRTLGDEPWQQPLHRPLAGDLVVIIARDNVDSFLYPPSKEVTGLFGDEAAAWTAIEAHTQAQMGEIVLEDVGSGISVLSAREDIAASLMLNDEIWEAPAIQALGRRPAVGVVKSGLLIVDSENAEAVRMLRAVLVEAEASSDYLSSNLFVRKDGQWSVLDN